MAGSAIAGVPVDSEGVAMGELVSDDEEPVEVAVPSRYNHSFGTLPRSIWFAAAKSGDVGILKALIESGTARVNARGDWGKSALHHAVEHRRTNAVKLLLAAHADPNACDRESQDAPLHMAAYQGSVNIVRALLQFGADLDQRNGNGRTPASLASQTGGGPQAHKEEVCELIYGWRIAVPGEPVLVRCGVGEVDNVYFFGRDSLQQQAFSV